MSRKKHAERQVLHPAQRLKERFDTFLAAYTSVEKKVGQGSIRFLGRCLFAPNRNTVIDDLYVLKAGVAFQRPKVGVANQLTDANQGVYLAIDPLPQCTGLCRPCQVLRSDQSERMACVTFCPSREKIDLPTVDMQDIRMVGIQYFG